MNKAAFSLETYHFDKVMIDFSKKTSNDLKIAFSPSGRFDPEQSIFTLKFMFNANNDEDFENSFVQVECIAIFKFEDKIEFENIPPYFYRNCIAIIFPYVRSFVSTVTLQANIPPIVLPTLNLSSLEIPLKENTKQI